MAERVMLTRVGMADETLAWFTADEFLFLCRSLVNLVENLDFDVGEPCTCTACVARINGQKIYNNWKYFGWNRHEHTRLVPIRV